MSRASACLACLAALLLGTSLPALSAAATAVDLAHCAAIAAPGARLACYDALAGRAPDQAAAADGAAPPAPAAKAATAAAAPRPSAPAAAPANGTGNFGLSAAQLHPAPAGPPAIQARIEKLIGGVGTGRPTLVLEGGQTWVFTQLLDDPRLGPGDLVTIKRGALGSFVLMTPSKHFYHVRRTE